MEYIIVSSCLLGVNCRYDGGNEFRENIKGLMTKYNLIPVCGEIFGGMTTPRNPSEIIGDKVFDNSGIDVSENFYRGAEEVVNLCKLYDCKLAILKSNSPSCGFGQIYDGTFSGNKVDGMGITAKLLDKNGVQIFNEINFVELLK